MRERRVHRYPVLYFSVPAASSDVMDLRAARYRLAEQLAKEGFQEGHWYANWVKIKEKVWLMISGRREIRSAFEQEMTAYLMFQDKPPNEGVGGQYTLPESKARMLTVMLRPALAEMLKKFNCTVLPDTEFPHFLVY